MADIGTILDHFNVESCWLIGASFGSSLAAKYCLAQPARVDGLILIAPTLDGFEPSPSIKEFWRREEELLQADDLAAAVELNLRFWFDGPNRPRQQVDQAKRALVGQMQLKAFQQPEPAGVELTDRKVKDLKEYESLTCPVLMVTGAEDDPAVLAHAHQLLEVLPNAELFELEKGGHMVSMERPGRVNQLILDAIHQERT